MVKPQRIIAVHLLNDFSGSPLVLRQSLEVMSHTFEVHLFTSVPADGGVLSNVPNIINHRIAYNWYPNKWVTLIGFLWAQLVLFGKMVVMLKRTDTVYINTLLPFGAALAGFCKRTKVVYHIHEVTMRPALLKLFLVKVANHCASKIIFVSAYVKAQYRFKENKTLVVHNALPDAFVKEALQSTVPNLDTTFTVLMLCSFKAYKGIYEFVEVAKRMPHINFILVMNTCEREKDMFLNETAAPSNCDIYSVQQQTASFYKKAHVIANLSKPDEWLETFGMTILEGMFYGLPAIVPPVGGVTELIENGVEGLQVDSRNIEAIINAISQLSTNKTYYLQLAKAARHKASYFSQQAFKQKIHVLFNTNYKE